MYYIFIYTKCIIFSFPYGECKIVDSTVLYRLTFHKIFIKRNTVLYLSNLSDIYSCIWDFLWQEKWTTCKTVIYWICQCSPENLSRTTEEAKSSHTTSSCWWHCKSRASKWLLHRKVTNIYNSTFVFFIRHGNGLKHFCMVDLCWEFYNIPIFFFNTCLGLKRSIQWSGVLMWKAIDMHQVWTLVQDLLRWKNSVLS